MTVKNSTSAILTIVKKKKVKRILYIDVQNKIGKDYCRQKYKIILKG